MTASDKDMHEAVAIGCLVVGGISGIVALILYAVAATEQSGLDLIMALILTLTTGAGLWGAGYFGDRLNEDWVNSGTKEHVLTVRQKRYLRRKRGEVVLEQALIEVEQERDNITHRAITAANDPNKPPHETQWSPGGVVPQPVLMPAKQVRKIKQRKGDYACIADNCTRSVPVDEPFCEYHDWHDVRE